MRGEELAHLVLGTIFLVYSNMHVLPSVGMSQVRPMHVGCMLQTSSWHGKKNRTCM